MFPPHDSITVGYVTYVKADFILSRIATEARLFPWIRKIYSAKFGACGTMRQEKKGVSEGSFGILTLWEWKGGHSGSFSPKRVIPF